MRRLLWALLFAAVAVAGVIVVVSLTRLAQAPTEAASAERLAPGGPMRTVRLFFGAPDRIGLVTEERVLSQPADDEALAESIVRELFRGPVSGVSGLWPGAQVRAFYMTAGGEAHLDLSRDLIRHWPRGDANEYIALASIVLSVTENVPSVRSVQILFDGRILTHPAGSIPLDLPLEPQAFASAIEEAS